MSPKLNSGIAVIGIDIGKNSFHVVGHVKRGAIKLWQKWSRGQVETRLATCRRASSAWRPVWAHIISAANSDRLVTRLSADAGDIAQLLFNPCSRWGA
jgi:hypothetical protein